MTLLESDLGLLLELLDPEPLEQNPELELELPNLESFWCGLCQ